MPSYSSIRSTTTSAKSGGSEDAINKLAQAIYDLTRNIEKDIADLKREIDGIKYKMR